MWNWRRRYIPITYKPLPRSLVGALPNPFSICPHLISYIMDAKQVCRWSKYGYGTLMELVMYHRTSISWLAKCSKYGLIWRQENSVLSFILNHCISKCLGNFIVTFSEIISLFECQGIRATEYYDTLYVTRSYDNIVDLWLLERNISN